jgi:Xaa-Pro aminopeptidase
MRRPESTEMTRCPSERAAFSPFALIGGITIFGFLLVSCRNYGGSSPEGAWYPEEILSARERAEEASVKLERLMAFLKRESLAGILIQKPSNFAWVTAGAAGRAADGRRSAALALFVRADGRRFLIAGAADILRLEREDLIGLGFEGREIPWHESKLPADVAAELAAGRPFGSDRPAAGARRLDSELTGLRTPLLDSEVRKYRWLGRRCAEVLDAVCRRLAPGMTERGIEAMVAAELMRHAIQPVSLRIATDDRILKYRAPFASGKQKLEKLAMVDICAARWGLHVAAARFVHFGSLPPELKKGLEAVARVNAGLWARTLPGTRASALLEGAIEDYWDSGYPEEWHRGGQGGATGYEELDWSALPGSPHVIQSGMVFSWTPNVQGLSVRDTILVLGDSLEVLTEIRNWPVVESRALGRVYRSPGILIR